MFQVVTLTVRPVLILHVQLAQTEIAERDMASVIKQDVLRLQVSINDVEAVETFQSAEQLGSVETCTIDVEALLLLKMVEKLAAVNEGEDKVKLLWRLEREFERYNEGVVDLRKH